MFIYIYMCNSIQYFFSKMIIHISSLIPYLHFQINSSREIIHSSILYTIAKPYYLQHINSITKIKLISIQKKKKDIKRYKTHICNSNQIFLLRNDNSYSKSYSPSQTSYDREDKPGTFVSPRSIPWKVNSLPAFAARFR